jgi:hypothetical protein
MPLGAIHLLIVVSLLYLWIEFGSRLRFLIYDRMTLWKLAESIEGPLPADRSVALDSLRPMLLGRPFLDSWFRTFLPSYTVSWYSPGQGSKGLVESLNLAIWSVSASMIGLAPATAWVMLEDVRLLWGSNTLARRTLPIFQCFIALLIISCYLFFVRAGHGGKFFIGCAIAAGMWIEMLPRLASLGERSRKSVEPRVAWSTRPATKRPRRVRTRRSRGVGTPPPVARGADFRVRR